MLVKVGGGSCALLIPSSLVFFWFLSIKLKQCNLVIVCHSMYIYYMWWRSHLELSISYDDGLSVCHKQTILMFV